MSATRRLGTVLLGLALAAEAAAIARADPPGTKNLLGAFVGRAHDEDFPGSAGEQRDVDMEILPYQGDGLKVRWTNVTLVDGRRDLPGVKRRTDELLLAPAPGRSFFLAGVGYDPFRDKQAADPIKGDPLRWAAVAGDTLSTYSFVIDDDGTYELQTSTRSSSADGIGLEFERVVDGEVLRRMTGHAVRAE